MKPFHLLLLSVFVVSNCLGQGIGLDNATVRTVSMHANDVVYDRTRDLLFVTVGSLAGAPYGNSIVMINPETLEIVDSFFVGSEPVRIAMSVDGRHGYVGINGANALRYFNPATKEIGPLRSLFGLSDRAVAQELETDPADGRNVVVSCDDVSSSATGNLVTF